MEILHKCRICTEENFPFQEMFKFKYRVKNIIDKISLIETLRKQLDLPVSKFIYHNIQGVRLSKIEEKALILIARISPYILLQKL